MSEYNLDCKNSSVELILNDFKSKLSITIDKNDYENMLEFFNTATPILQMKIAEQARSKDVINAIVNYLIKSIKARNDDIKTGKKIGTRVEAHVKELIAKNEALYKQKAENPEVVYDMVGITITYLANNKYTLDDGKQITHNRQTVSTWMKANSDMIAEHHRSVEILDPVKQNVMAGRYRKRNGVDGE
jgi:hypothetical protein